MVRTGKASSAMLLHRSTLVPRINALIAIGC